MSLLPRSLLPRPLLPRIVACLIVVFQGGKASTEPPTPGDYLATVTAYADAMIRDGRDTYGTVHSPLFAEALDRRTMRLLEGEALARVEAIPREAWGIRPHDRMLGGANPQHCENLYQLLYAVSKITGNPRYAAEADRSLAWFFQNCQSPATGLLCWGEHSGWDFHADTRLATRQGNTHEFYRHWVLWDRSYELAPEPCRKFALGLWQHQIGDHQTGDYSRHAKIDEHGPGTNAPYARHGGMYVITWATAYEKTGHPIFLEAIRSVVHGLERARLTEGGMLVSQTKATGTRRPYDVSLAVSLDEAAAKVPGDLARRLREVAAANDRAFLENLSAEDVRPPKPGNEAALEENLWSNGYGSGGEIASAANLLAVRYRQTQHPAFRLRILKAADRYADDQIDLSYPVYPGTVGDVILLLLNAHELTGQARYLESADALAQRAIGLFLGDGRPLPKAAHVFDHYEAATEADTLMMALLELWALKQSPPIDLELVYANR